MDELEMIPRTELPGDLLKIQRSKNRARRWMMFMGNFGLIIIVVLGFMVIASNNRAAQAKLNVTPTAQPTATADATAVVTAWVDGAANPVSSAAADNKPGLGDVKLIGWAGAEVHAGQKFKLDATNTVSGQLELHKFAAMSNGRLFYIQIQMAVSGDKHWALSSPSMSAAVNAGTNPDQQWSWAGLDPSAGVDPHVTEALGRWSKAYTSGSAEDLKAVTQDPKAERIYAPLPATYIVDNTSGMFAAKVDNGTIVRVRLDVSTAAGGSAFLDFDVLVNNADTATPNVVAWGAPGTGPTLSAFSNGLESTIDVDPTVIANKTTTTVASTDSTEAATVTTTAPVETTVGPTASAGGAFEAITPVRDLDQRVDANAPVTVRLAEPGIKSVLVNVTFVAETAGDAVQVFGTPTTEGFGEVPVAVLSGDGSTDAEMTVIRLDENGQASVQASAAGRLVLDVLARS